MSVDVINIGSINIDHVYRVPTLVRPGETIASTSLSIGLGGKGANQSVALARAGATVAHVGQVAKADQWVLNELSDCGVNVGSVKQVDGVSGHAIIQVDENGENSIVLHGGANQSLDIALVDTAIADNPSARYWVMQNECNLLPEVFDLARERNSKLVFNPAPMTERIKQLPLAELDTLIVNQTEACALTGASEFEAIIDYFQENLSGVRTIVTLGAQGAILLRDSQTYQVAAEPADVVDTTGAGDTFVGYFLAAMLEGLDDEASLRLATKASSLAVANPGAIASIPMRKHLV